MQAYDEDGDEPTYTLEGTDRASFDIDQFGGQIRAKAPLNYESNKKKYSVTVKATDPAGHSDTAAVTITVTDVEEKGIVTLSTRHPKIAVPLTAALTDPDGGVTGTTWQWARYNTTTNRFDDITTAKSASYTPVTDDVGKLLRATASYTDRRPGSKTAFVVSEAVNDRLGIIGASSSNHLENDSSAVHTFTTSGSGGSTVRWSLPAGADRGDFSISSAGALTFRRTPNFESPADADRDNVYHVTVQASAGGETDDKPVTVTVTNVDEDGSVRLSSSSPRVGSQLTATLTDPDGSVSNVTWQWARDTSKNGSFTDNISEATSASYRPVPGDASKYLRATATYTDGQGGNKKAHGITDNIVNQPNRAPTFPNQNANQSRSIPENTGPNQDIGAAVKATDPDGDTPRYSLGGTDRASFALVAERGQLQTRAALDFERKPNYTVTVTARDQSGLTATVVVVISVTNVEEAGSVSLSSSSPSVGSQLTATLTDPDRVTSGSVTWKWQKSDDGNTGWSNVGTNSASYTPVAGDVNKYLKVTAEYTDWHGSGKTAHAITTSAVQTAPVFPSATDTRTVAENTSAGENIGNPITAPGSGLTYSLDSAGRSSFGIVSTSGQLRTRASLDYETRTSYTVTVTATNAARLSDSITVTISVTNEEEPGTVTLSQQPTVGTSLMATLRDPDGSISGESWVWSRADTRSGTYAPISGATSKSYTPADGDLGKYLKIAVSYTDGHGANKTAETTATSAVRQVNRSPSYSSGSGARSVAENTGPGTDIGDPVTATDPDTDDTLTYSLVGGDASSFGIDSSSGQLKTKAALDYESKNSYRVTVRANDGNGGTADISVTISVTDVNEPPTFNEGTAAGRSILESAQANTNIGSRIAATDPEGDALTYTLAGADSNAFSIDTSTGQLRTRVGLDRSVKSSYAFTVSVRDSKDGNGNADTATDDTISVTITVTVSNSAPAFSNQASTVTVAENTPSGRNIGQPVRATDSDTGDTLTYALGGTDAASFGIVPSSGQLQTRAALDYETRRKYAVTVTATDRNRASDTTAVNIGVTNVNESGRITLSSEWPRVGQALRASLVDPDAPITSLSWQWASAAAATGSFVNISGATSAAYTPVAGDVGRYLRVTVTYIDSLGSGRTVRRAPGNPVSQPRVNTAPTFTQNTVTRSIAENTRSGVNIGQPVAASDPDSGTGDRLTYAISGTDGASFGIVSSSGQLQTKAALDYETKNRYTVVVTATDRSGASDTITVTINVTNVVIPGRPNAPTVSAHSSSGHSTLSVRWTAPASAGTGIGGYNVQYRAGTTGNWYSIQRSVTGTSTTISGLIPSTTYRVQVRAYNSEGNSAWSDSGSGRTNAAPVQQQRVIPQSGGGGGGGVVTPVCETPQIGFRTGETWSFTAAQGGENPPGLYMEVWNRELCSMNFRVSSNAGWLSISPASSVSEGAHNQRLVKLFADISSLDMGTHTATVKITASRADNSPQTVNVNLTITEPVPVKPDYCSVSTAIESTDGAVRVVVPPGTAPCDTGITVGSLDAASQTIPEGVSAEIVRAASVNTGQTDLHINAGLWMLLPESAGSTCDVSGLAVYRVDEGSWSTVTHRCETDEQGLTWIVSPVTSFGVYILAGPEPSVEPVTSEDPPPTPEVVGTNVSIPARVPCRIVVFPIPDLPLTMTEPCRWVVAPGEAPAVVESSCQQMVSGDPSLEASEEDPECSLASVSVRRDTEAQTATTLSTWADLPPEETAPSTYRASQGQTDRIGILPYLAAVVAALAALGLAVAAVAVVRRLRTREAVNEGP